MPVPDLYMIVRDCYINGKFIRWAAPNFSGRWFKHHFLRAPIYFIIIKTDVLFQECLLLSDLKIYTIDVPSYMIKKVS